MRKKFIWIGNEFFAYSDGFVTDKDGNAVGVIIDDQGKAVIKFCGDKNLRKNSIIDSENNPIDCICNANEIFLDRLIAHFFVPNPNNKIFNVLKHKNKDELDCSKDNIVWSANHTALCEKERKFGAIQFLGHDTHYFIYCAETDEVYPNAKYAAKVIFSDYPESELTKIQSQITKCANGNQETLDYKHFAFARVAYVKDIEKIGQREFFKTPIGDFPCFIIFTDRVNERYDYLFEPEAIDLLKASMSHDCSTKWIIDYDYDFDGFYIPNDDYQIELFYKYFNMVKHKPINKRSLNYNYRKFEKAKEIKIEEERAKRKAEEQRLAREQEKQKAEDEKKKAQREWKNLTKSTSLERLYTAIVDLKIQHLEKLKYIKDTPFYVNSRDRKHMRSELNQISRKIHTLQNRIDKIGKGRLEEFEQKIREIDRQIGEI